MTDLQGKRVLVLEDDFYLASDEKALLERAGATVVGPFGSSFNAEELGSAGPLDAAVVDINLGRGPDFAAARYLAGQGVPFLFVTGYDAAVVPDDLATVPRLEKPVRERDLVPTLAALLGNAAKAEGWRLEAGGWRLEAGGWRLEATENRQAASRPKRGRSAGRQHQPQPPLVRPERSRGALPQPNQPPPSSGGTTSERQLCANSSHSGALCRLPEADACSGGALQAAGG